MVGVPNHSNWLTISRNASNDHDSPRAVSCINIRLSQFYFSLWKDIFNHRNILCVSFFNNESIYFLINSSQTALKYLKDTEANISNILIMARNFNIKDSSWDLSFLYHSIPCDLYNNIADYMDLCMSKATNYVPTRYSDN